MKTRSAHLPGVTEPMSRATSKHCATLMVTIWTAVIGSMPYSTALRRMRSRCPSETSVSGWLSSETRQTRRVSMAWPTTAFESSRRLCQAEPSRMSAYCPMRILAVTSSARVDS